jgi:glycosyltransferase involved in cell wall biosynthesis
MHKALVILTPGFPKDETDTTCIPDRQIFVKVLKETYPQLNIIVLTFHYPFIAAEYEWHGVKVIALGGKSKGHIHRRIIWARARKILKKLHTQFELTGLLSFWLGECAFVGQQFSEKYGIKYFCWLLGQDAKAGNKYVKRVNTSGENLIALSDFLVREFEKNYRITPAHVVPGAIDTSLFGTTPAERDIDIMGAGSLIPLKQYDVFVDVVDGLKKDMPGIKAVICGKGPEQQMLQDKIKQLGLENSITLTGELPHVGVLELMQRSKVFLHTSNYEGFGIVCLEALYAGAKVISLVRPMDADIANWHVVANKYGMQLAAKKFLNDAGNKYNSVLPYAMIDSVKAVMNLFDQQEAAIS